MLKHVTGLARHGATKLLRVGHGIDLTPKDVHEARDYIAHYWPKLERSHKKDEGSNVGLPKPYLVPAFAEGHEFDFDELYYWDCYFMIQGLLDEKHKSLVMGILDDLVFLFERFNMIPTASRTYLTSRSQPPFLTSFIMDVYRAYDPGLDWLQSKIEVAKKEYATVWMGTTKPNARKVYKGLSRYFDVNYTHDLAETESGWDYTTRFNRHCLVYLPVDLNALLYKYETDFAAVARLLGDEQEALLWDEAAQQRKHTVNHLMWDDRRGIYLDYNYFKEKRGNVASLAMYYPMWAGMADTHQARRLVKALRRFDRKGGLAATEELRQLGKYVPGAMTMPTQWAYPNGWAPLHYLVVRGLQRYGYHDEARRIAQKWLRTNLSWFKRKGIFLEKYNVVNPAKPPMKGVYPSQTGFGWTNSVFERFCQDFIDEPSKAAGQNSA